jgi:hypothetical protein
LGVAAAAFADDVHLTSAVTDILKLSQSQVSPAVLEAYIANSPIAYSPSPDEIVYMHKQGVPDEVVAAMIRHGMELRRPSAPAEAMAPPPGVPMPQTPPPDMEGAQPVPPYAAAQPAPAVQEVATTPYPYYGYPDYYWGPGYWGWGTTGWLWIGPGWRYRGFGGYGYRGGFGFGHGFGGGGFRGGFGGHAGGGHGGGHR